MWRPLVLAATLSALACSPPSVPRHPNAFAVPVDGFEPQKAAWYFEHCKLMHAQDTTGPSLAWLFGANFALVHSVADFGVGTLMFRCAERPSWPRADLEDLGDTIEKLEAEGFKCDAMAKLTQDKPEQVEVLAAGSGAPVRGDAFIRARVRTVGVVLGRDVTVHHGRVVESGGADQEHAHTLEKGTTQAVTEPPIEWVRHSTCWTGCVVEAMSQVKLGGKVRATCDGIVSEIEPLAEGDASLFRNFVGL